MSKVSRYDCIWVEIKKDRESLHPQGVKISAIPSLHSRIIKAVTKRKLNDLAYKFEQLETRKKVPRLDIKIQANIITFKLYYNRQLEGI